MHALRGQSSVEFLVALPCILMLVLIVYNASLLCVECAAFDRLARSEIIRNHYVYGPYRQARAASYAQTHKVLNERFSAPYEKVELSSELHGDMMHYEAKLTFYPHVYKDRLGLTFLNYDFPGVEHRVAIALSADGSE